MKKKWILFLITILLPFYIIGQDLTEGLVVNDLSLHPMQDIAKPEYLSTIIDPSFGTTIRRITDAGPGNVIVPMYSTVQAWNADETLMILYNQSSSTHELLNGITYQYLRSLDDISPNDLEQIFWDFNDPDVFYYPDNLTSDFIKYTVSTQSKESIVNLVDISACSGEIEMGNDIQMMSWDSDVFTFRCGNEMTYSYRISTGELTDFNIEEINFTAPGVAPSGDRFYHNKEAYDLFGNSIIELNKNAVEHSCIGQLPNGNDAFYSIAFQEGPQGGCIGDIIAHDLITGECIPVISQSQGYDYPQSGTHISALAHKNTQGGWVAASMIGYDKDGQELLDQELVIARAEAGNIQVCRIGHHRSDEDEVDYWGEPHAVISPLGTRVLFASDWSGVEDGQSIDSYVVELPSYTEISTTDLFNDNRVKCNVFPNPVKDVLNIHLEHSMLSASKILIYDSNGKVLITQNFHSHQNIISTTRLSPGIYFYSLDNESEIKVKGRFIKW